LPLVFPYDRADRFLEPDHLKKVFQIIEYFNKSLANSIDNFGKNLLGFPVIL